MRRALAVLLGAAAVVMPASGALAGEQETPQGRMSAPNRAPAGAPIWVRSITPCPGASDPNRYLFVRVGISPQSEPNNLSYVESTDGDLRDDGSWEVTLSAPADMAAGVTKSYTIHAQCIENVEPYATPDSGESETEDTTTTTVAEDTTTDTTAPEEESSEGADKANFSYFRYFYRTLYVTGFSSAPSSDEGVSAQSTDDAGDTSDTSGDSSTSSSDADLSAQATYSAAALDTDSVTTDADATTEPTWVDDQAQRAAEARAELAAQGIDVSDMSDEEVLLASPASSARERTRSGGVPWWSFVAATMLAVGAVIAWGSRRSDPVAAWDTADSGEPAGEPSDGGASTADSAR